MTTFVQFRDILNQQITKMTEGSAPVFRVNVDTDVMRAFYLDSFPEGTNKMYRERREYDCTCCLRFIRDVGALVTLDSNMQMNTIWDIQVDGYYQAVCDAMSDFVKRHAIGDFFLNDEAKIGELRNFELIDGTQKEWNHFYTKLPSHLVMAGVDIPSKLGELRTNFEMLERSLREFSLDAANVVLDLIDQNSLYRGSEKRHIVTNFITAKREYESLNGINAYNYCWVKSAELGKAGRFRGDVIGTLIEDLSQGVELEVAVKKFEDKVSGTNYQRPTALVTKAMIERAQQKVVELGLTDSLERRFAVAGDLTINNVLFADRSIKGAMKNGFDALLDDAKKSDVKLDKVEKIKIADFIANVLPTATSLEVMFANAHRNNLFSLIAPMHDSAPNLFKWGNPFSWSYTGEVADSIRERVKAAGGNVDGDVRASLAWHNSDDLDLHVFEPDGNHIYFSRGSRKSARTGGHLDIDMNGMDRHDDKNPVENITWADQSRMNPGVYKVVVHNFNKRSTANIGFTLQFAVKGKVYTFDHPKDLRNKEEVVVLSFKYSHDKGVEVVSSLPFKEQKQSLWGINTQEFHRVKMVLSSPNHWDGEQTGSKHYFFVLDGCQNPDDARGFYNEFLKPELVEHRKVFELLGSKMKAVNKPEQLSGLGFTATNANSVHVKVGGSFERVLEVLF